MPPTPAPLAVDDEPAPAPPIRLSKPPVVEQPATAPERAAESQEPTSPSPTVAHDLRLSAISQRDGKPVALINDRLVFEGDSFDGVRVIRIGDTEVEVEVKGQRRVLRF